MDQTRFYWILTGLVLLIMSAAILPGLHSGITLQPAKVNTTITPIIPAQSDITNESAGISIEELKKQAGDFYDNKGQDSTQNESSTLAEVYSRYPDATVGNNMVASWARTSPEEKAKVEEHLDKEVILAQDALKTNPEDKKAKHMLFITSTLKKLCKNNFDYKLLESIPEEEGGLLSKSKKPSRP